MHQLTCVEPKRLRWLETKTPQLSGPRQALVRPLAVTLCDIDRPMADGRFPIPAPIELGHEVVAEVVEVGDAVTTVRAGDRVVVPFQISCGECARCRAGLTAHCHAVPARTQYGFGAVGGNVGGAFCDLMLVPFADGMLLRVPAGIEPHAAACASDNLVDAWRSVAPGLAEMPGADVLILGGIGSVPLYCVDVARACGAGRIDYLDDDRHRLAVAEKLGARPLEGPLRDGIGEYDITIDGTLLNPKGLACALKSLRPNGLCVAATLYLEDPCIPMFVMYSRGARLVTGRVNARAGMAAVLDLMQSGRIDPTKVTECVVPFDSALEGFFEPTLKPVFVRT